MTKLTGTVQSVQTDHEGDTAVLKFIAQTENDERIPVEMRGRQVIGILEPGDRVAIEGKKHRDRYGVMHLDEVENLTTKSIVRVKSPGLMRRMASFVFSLGLSALTVVLSSHLTSYLSSILSPAKRARYKLSPGAAPPMEPVFSDPLALLVGITAGLIVFYFVYLRRRRR